MDEKGWKWMERLLQTIFEHWVIIGLYLRVISNSPETQGYLFMRVLVQMSAFVDLSIQKTTK